MWLTACGGGGSSAGGAAGAASAPASQASGALTAEQVRDEALDAMRRLDLSGGWTGTGNWGNGAYGSWNQYLTHQISAATYAAAVAANPGSGYYFNDLYGFFRPSATPPSSPDYAAIVAHNGPCYFGPTQFNTLSTAYYGTQDPVYLSTWLNITRDMMLNERSAIAPYLATLSQPLKDCLYAESGNAGALLNMGAQISGELYAFATLAKGVGLSAKSDWNSQSVLVRSTPLTASERALFPADQVVDIANGIAAHYVPTLLQWYAHSGRAPNQRFIGLYGPALLTQFFPSLPAVAAVTPDIESAVQSYIADDTHLDGGQLEQSFNYAGLTVVGMESLSRMQGRPWAARAAAAAADWHAQMAAISTPQGGSPQMGNTEWSSGTLRNGYAFSQTSIAFPYSGYYAQRSDWTADSPYLFFFSKRGTAGHSMRGSNAIQMGAYGRKLIVAGGSANYAAAPAAYPNLNAYLAEDSTWKTSTVVVDGLSQAGASTAGLYLNSAGQPDGSRTPKDPIQSRWATSTYFDFVEGSYTSQYGNSAAPIGRVAHQRMVTFVRDLKAWVVVDYLYSANGNHGYTQIWKFAPPLPQAQSSATQTEGFYPSQINLPATGTGVNRLYTSDTTLGAVNLSLYQVSPQALSYRQYYGDSASAVYGYYGPTPMFSPDVHVDWSGAGNQVLISVLLPFQGAAADGVSQSNNTTANGMAGLDLVINGKSLSIRANAIGATLNLAALTVTEADTDGASPRSLTVGDSTVTAASSIHDANGVTLISIPTGFHWNIDAAGTKAAVYQP